jgi:hypothetical protein
MSGKKLALLILSSIGGLFLLVGLGLLLLGRSQAQEINRVAAGEVLHTLTQLSQTPSGAAVMLQGQIAEHNSLLEQDFVAYVRRQYQGERCVTPTPTRDNYEGGSTCESIWAAEKRETPSLWLELSEGRVQLAHTGYRLQNPPTTWQSTANLVKNQTLRYEGFKIGDPVFTQGTVVMAGDTPTLSVDFIFGGDSQAYFNNQRSSNSVLFLLGSIFISVGAMTLAVMGVILWVGRKK